MKNILPALLLLGFTLTNGSVSAQVNLPFVEDFSAASTSLAEWNYTNPDPIVIHNTAASAYGQGAGSLMYNFFNSMGHVNYNVQTPLINNSSGSGLKLSFDFAGCARYTMPVAIQTAFANDYIYIEYSKDSGITWNLLDTMRIGTNGPLNSFGGNGISPNMVFNPNSSQWVSINSIKLPRGTNKVSFKGVRNNPVQMGNMAYLDNVSIDTCYAAMVQADTVQYSSTYTSITDLVVTGDSLQWYSDVGASNSISDTTSLQDSTYYYVTNTVNGCESAPLAIWYGDTTTVVEPPVDTGTTSLNEMRLFSGIKLFPNPIVDRLSIESKYALTSLVLYDISGRVLMEEKGNVKHLSMSQLASGQYFVQIEIEGQRKTYKINKR